MQSIDECDKIPKDDSPAHTAVGKHYNTPTAPAFNVAPSETLENLKLKVQLAHMTKWPTSKRNPHISQDAAMMRLKLGTAHIKGTSSCPTATPAIWIPLNLILALHFSSNLSFCFHA